MIHHLHKLSLIAFFTGFTANIAQVALFRFFMGQFYGTEIHLGLFLSIWLSGTAIGSFVGGKINAGPRLLLSALFVLPLISVVTLYYGSQFLPAPDGGFITFAPVAGCMLITVTPISFMIGMLIPSLLRLCRQSLGFFYGLEALGGFIGGLFFSLLLGGNADSILCLLVLPLLPMTALTLIARKKAVPAVLTLLLAPLVWHFGPETARAIENNWWQRLHGMLSLEQTVETPYQKLQVASYYDQKSLFSNGMLADSWPDKETAEARAHVFATSLHNPGEILLIGAPAREIVSELLKYENSHITIVESDQHALSLLGYFKSPPERTSLIVDDPRSFLNSYTGRFDGIMICPVSPVTLVGNRLFTVEAFGAMKNRLKPTGVLSLQVEGSENYLGTIKEKLILATWQALKAEFLNYAAFPGATITFFASQKPLSSDAKALGTRFAARKIETVTFIPMSFFNILMPFRVKELDQWLRKDRLQSLNTDSHPATFMQQLELWNIYSGTSLNTLLQVLQQTSFSGLLLVISAAGFILLLFAAVLSPGLATRSIVAGGVAVSGATGLLSEIILILLYQNRCGAAYQMTALFFGLYMLGLATGSRMFGYIHLRSAAVSRLKHIKLFQIVFTSCCIAFIDGFSLHSGPVIGGMIFLIAFLDGIEFPVADSILRGNGRSAHNSAGLLLFSDSAGAMLVGAVSGLWLLPAFGMQKCFLLLCGALTINYAALLIFSGKIHKA